MRRPLAFGLSFFFLRFGVIAQETTETSPVYDTALVREFADYLADQGDFREASLEYQRYLFMADQPSSTAVVALADIFVQQGDYAATLGLADRYLPTLPADEWSVRLSYLKGFSLFSLTRYQELDAFFRSTGLDTPNPLPFEALRVSSSIYQGQFDSARAITAKYPEDPLARNLDALLTAYRPRRPGLALALSSIVPGLGKIYARQYGDGIFSFVAVGSFAAWATYSWMTEGRESWRPWVYGSAAGIFYSANLYGSYQAALRYNTAREGDIRAGADAFRESYRETHHGPGY